MKKTFISLLLTASICGYANDRDVLDLSGKWTVGLDSTDIGLTENWQERLFTTPISLPGTTDGAGLGIENTLKPALTKPQLTYLTRKHKHVGPAWYSRNIEIPKDWNGKDIFLTLERAMWDTQVWIDGKKVEGHEESLVTPHHYDITRYVTPGSKHLISIRVDNRKRYDISNGMAHAYTNHTQIIWNGILGDMEIQAKDPVRIETVDLYPDLNSNNVKAVIEISNNSGSEREAVIQFGVKGLKDIAPSKKTVALKKGVNRIETVQDMGNSYVKWSEFTPEIYTASVSLESEGMKSQKEETFGMRELKRDGNKLILNDAPLFLRGTLECCIFPLTGTPPMDKKGWKKVFSAAKEYGLNHLRFHSWCPPEAAFEAADEMGFYLQIELPAWVLTIGKSPDAVRFLRAEAENIRREYGNHPSLCLWSLGNELQGDFRILSDMLDELKAKDSRHLYTTTSFTFENGHGRWPEKNDDYFVTQWTKKGWVRGQGVFNQEVPSFDKNYNASVEGMEVPLITHEVGQYSVYPDLNEIKKYKGVLMPLNFMAVKEDLIKKGLIDKADDYLKSSGKLAAILYKEEIERALKTAGISGFQLLDLHDFPGQGTALVGLLNAFWESKGIIDGKDFREFCSPVVPLLNFPKAIYLNSETFNGEFVVCNYGKSVLHNKNIEWTVSCNGKKISSGKTQVSSLGIGYNGELGTMSVPLANITEASKLEIELGIEGTDYKNRWNIWVYPDNQTVEWGDVVYTRDFAEAESLLAQGKKVLFNPDWKTMKGIEGKFVPVFWSPVHFPNQAGTMGLLCNPKHDALKQFPTDSYTDWQWWDLNINSTTLITDNLKGGDAIVEMIDNFANNRKLASLYEGQVGNGRLMLATFDLERNLNKRPVAKQMLISILDYMNSDKFNPSVLSNFDTLKDIVGKTENNKQSAEGIY